MSLCLLLCLSRAVMLILSTESAVNTFKSRAQISVGAELGVSVGPVGRSIESDVTAGNKGAGDGHAMPCHATLHSFLLCSLCSDLT